MDDELSDEARTLSDAALVHAASRRIGEAASALGQRPLDEVAVAEMCQALGEGPTAQAALRRLRAVEPVAGDEAADLISDADGVSLIVEETPPRQISRARRFPVRAPGGGAA